MSEPIIQIRNLSFSYPGGQQALKNISLEVAEGEYLAIVGPNGAGKTTLCLFLNGIIPNVMGGRVAGEVRVLGYNTFEHHVYEIAQHVGLVLQDPEAQLLAADVRSEIAFAAENRGIPRDEIRLRLAEALKIVRLEGLEERLSDELSGGQKQRLATAANLVVRPRILVADEPTSQLDPIGKEEVFATLRALNREHGMTVIIASHDVDEIVRHADRVIALNEGRVVLAGPPTQVFREIEALDRIYVHVPDLARLGGWLKRNGAEPLSLDVHEAAAQLQPQLREIPAAATAKAKPSQPAPAEVVIEVRQLSYTYPGGSVPALASLSFQIPKGQFVGLIGQNGAGKTTLMKCMVGLLKPSAGEVRLNGQAVAQQKVKALARQIGLILQNPDTQLFRMSVEEEILFGLTNLGLNEAEMSERVEQALAITGLTAQRTLYPFKLSLGDRRKVAVASIIAMRPPILIFDEPLTGQDYKGRYDLCNLAAELHRAGHTILMITHDMELVAKYTERTLVLGQGSLLLDAPTSTVFDHLEILRSTFIEPPELVRLAQALGLRGVFTVDELADMFLINEQLAMSN
jgi:energy-coupling factor transport system ATP-binding protein